MNRTDCASGGKCCFGGDDCCFWCGVETFSLSSASCFSSPSHNHLMESLNSTMTMLCFHGNTEMYEEIRPAASRPRKKGKHIMFARRANRLRLSYRLHHPFTCTTPDG